MKKLKNWDNKTWLSSKSYISQFNKFLKTKINLNKNSKILDPIGIKKRPILMMDGFAGQQVVIDFNKSKIITVHSTDAHYDWYSLVYLQLEPDLFYKPVKNN